MKILAVIPTLRDDPTETIQSILKQSVSVTKIVTVVGDKALCNRLDSLKLEQTTNIFVKPNFRQPLGKRVAAAINTALAQEDLSNYDYILKVDAEILLPRDFIKINTEKGQDFVGSGGTAMIFKTSAFIEGLGGKYPEASADDTYLALRFMYEGFTVKRWICPPIYKGREKGHHSYKHKFQRGMELYRLGYEPIHVLEYPRDQVSKLKVDRLLDSLFPIIGYFWGALKRIERYELASWVFTMQTRRLLYGKQFEY